MPVTTLDDSIPHMKAQNNHKPSFLFGSAPFGGIVTHIRNLKESLDTRTDIDCTWLFMEQNPKELFSHIPPFSLNWTLKGGMVMHSRIRALEKSGKTFDAAFFNHITPVSLLGEFQKRVPIVISIDTTPRLLERYADWYHTATGSRKNPIEAIKHKHVRGIYQRAAYLFPWTRSVKNSLIEDYSVDENKIKVLPPGIDLKKWNGRPVEPNKDNEKVRILFVGGEFRRKGGDLLVKLAKHDEFRDCEFHFATQSFEGEPAANIFIHHDLPPNSEELIALYQSADVFALPTRADLFSVAGLEAMAMRLPVVMTNVGATAEIVRDGESGYIIPINDEQALADRLLRLVKNKALRREFGQKGRKIIEENINIEKNAEVIVETLKCVSNTGK